MRTALLPALLACTVVTASPAAADGISLQKGVKLCKAAFAKQDNPPIRYRFDDRDSSASSTHFWLAFNIRSSEDRFEKVICTVDRTAQTATISRK